MDDLCDGPLEKLVIVSWEEGEWDRSALTRSGSNTTRVEFDEEVIPMGVSPENGAAKTCSWFDEGVR